MADIREIIQKIADKGEEIYSQVCVVKEVYPKNSTSEPADRTCDLDPINGGAPILGVKLQAEITSDLGFVLLPRKGSYVVATFLNKHSAYISLCSELDRIECKIVNDPEIPGSDPSETNLVLNELGVSCEFILNDEITTIDIGKNNFGDKEYDILCKIDDGSANVNTILLKADELKSSIKNTDETFTNTTTVTKDNIVTEIKDSDGKLTNTITTTKDNIVTEIKDSNDGGLSNTTTTTKDDVVSVITDGDKTNTITTTLGGVISEIKEGDLTNTITTTLDDLKAEITDGSFTNTITAKKDSLDTIISDGSIDYKLLIDSNANKSITTQVVSDSNTTSLILTDGNIKANVNDTDYIEIADDSITLENTSGSTVTLDATTATLSNGSKSIAIDGSDILIDGGNITLSASKLTIGSSLEVTI